MRANAGDYMAGATARTGLLFAYSGVSCHAMSHLALDQTMTDAGVRFVSSPRNEPCGRIVVFMDLEGNRWDLLGPAPIR